MSAAISNDDRRLLEMARGTLVALGMADVVMSAEDMIEGARRRQMLLTWVKDGKVQTSNPTLPTRANRYVVGDVYFDDADAPFPSEALIANIALALQAGVGNG